MMRRIVIPSLVLAVLCAGAVPALAGSALDLLYPGVVNKLEDDDWETMVDMNNSGTLDENDFLVGMLWIQYTEEAGTSNKKLPKFDAFTGEFVMKVLKVEAAGSLWKYTMGPATATEWGTINTLTGWDLELPFAAGSIGTIYLDTRVSGPWVDAYATDIQAALDTADTNVTTPLWDFGFAGKADEHWTAYATQLNIDKSLQVTTYASVNVTHKYADGVPLLYHNYMGDDGYPQYTGPTQLQAYGVLEAGGNGVFQIKTDTDFYIKPTPEPASLALLGLGLAACGLFVRRRRR